MSAPVHCQRQCGDRVGCGKTWPRDPVLEVACPSCHAPAGRACRRPSGHGVWGTYGKFCDTRDMAAYRAGAYGACPLGLCGLTADAAARRGEIAQGELPL